MLLVASNDPEIRQMLSDCEKANGPHGKIFNALRNMKLKENDNGLPSLRSEPAPATPAAATPGAAPGKRAAPPAGQQPGPGRY